MVVKLILFELLLSVACYTDIKNRLIPDEVSLAVLVVSFFPPCRFHPEGFLIFLLLLGIALREGGIGGGDIKLMSACAFTLGLKEAAIGIMMSYLLLFCLHIGIVLHKRKKNKMKRQNIKGQAYPLAPFLLVGMSISAWLFMGGS